MQEKYIKNRRFVRPETRKSTHQEPFLGVGYWQSNDSIFFVQQYQRLSSMSDETHYLLRLVPWNSLALISDWLKGLMMADKAFHRRCDVGVYSILLLLDKMKVVQRYRVLCLLSWLEERLAWIETIEACKRYSGIVYHMESEPCICARTKSMGNGVRAIRASVSVYYIPGRRLGVSVTPSCIIYCDRGLLPQ